MTNPQNPAGFARLGPWQARVVLGAALATAVAAAALTLSSAASSNRDPHRTSRGDVALYRAEVDRIRAGAGYYDAAAAELRGRGYPTQSTFNWRTPLPMWLIAKLPPNGGKALLAALSLLLLALAFEALARDGKSGARGARPTRRVTGVTAGLSSSAGPHPDPLPTTLRAVPGEGELIGNPRPKGEGGPVGGVSSGADCQRSTAPRRGRMPWTAVAGVLLLSGPLLFVVLGDLYVMPVLWAGVLIALSLCAFGVQRPGWGIVFGVAAVFVRELALPYAALSAVLALARRQWREAIGWCLGLTAWAACFALHAAVVAHYIWPGDRAHAEGWVQFGGAAFIISTAQMNAYLLLLPQWATALFVVAALLGFADWNTPWGHRVAATALVFAVAFAVVGQPFNQYWGSLVAPLWCLGAARAPAAIATLLQAAKGSQEWRAGLVGQATRG